VVRHTLIREITDKEQNKLYSLFDTNLDIKYRIKIILLATDGYTVPEIREMTNTYDKTIRKWIHKFNDMGIDLAIIFDQMKDSLKNKLSNMNQKRQQKTRRYVSYSEK